MFHVFEIVALLLKLIKEEFLLVTVLKEKLWKRSFVNYSIKMKETVTRIEFLLLEFESELKMYRCFYGKIYTLSVYLYCFVFFFFYYLVLAFIWVCDYLKKKLQFKRNIVHNFSDCTIREWHILGFKVIFGNEPSLCCKKPRFTKYGKYKTV